MTRCETNQGCVLCTMCVRKTKLAESIPIKFHWSMVRVQDVVTYSCPAFVYSEEKTNVKT